MRKRQAELANLVMTIGEKGLLEIFLSDFWGKVQNTKIPGRGETKVFKFYGLKVVEIGPNIPCLFGHFVKLMNLRAEQKFDEELNQTVPSLETVDSAPSSFFLVSLADHKLVFLPESTRRYPTLTDLEYCFDYILRESWIEKRTEARKKLLEQIGKDRIPKGHAENWKQELERLYPRPEVRITPLPASMDLKKRLDLYDLLASVQIQPLKTNNELPDENEEFLQQYAKTQKRLGSTSDKISLSNSKEGLNKGEAGKFVSRASNGNYNVKLKGKDKAGRPLIDDLENLKIKVVYSPKKGESSAEKAVKLLDILINAIKMNLVSILSAPIAAIEKARELVKKIQGIENGN